MKKGEIKTGLNQISYELVKRIGKGGQAEVWSVKSRKDGKLYAYKYYKHNTNCVRSNIEDLIKIGEFHDKYGKTLSSVVLPITIVDEENDSFGYVMDLVDLEDFTNLKKAWVNEYPSCRAICRIVKNLATVFDTFHLSYGMCYKDVNEGNIFFNSKTGDIKIIDNDNVGYSDKFTIKGTSGYMAPEVVLGAKPDQKSDRFSLAVYIYRLLVGGFPFEGPYTEEYCQKYNVLSDDARKVIFGSDPVFVWNPNDKRNCIEKRKDIESVGQTELWRMLPNEVKDMFIKTFVTNLPKSRCAERATDQDWYDVFDYLENTLVKCPHCGEEVFSGITDCFSCGAKLPKMNPAKAQTRNLKIPNYQSKLLPYSTSQKETKNRGFPIHSHKAVFTILSIGENKRHATYEVSALVNGENISSQLPEGPLFKVLYNKSEKKIGIRNLGNRPWKVYYEDAFGKTVKTECACGQVQELKKGMRIRIISKVAHLNVDDLI